MPFTFNPCPIEGLCEITPRIFADDRGSFFEAWSRRDYEEAGISLPFVQDNQSSSVRGVLRGLHFQKTHPQGKLVRSIFGEVFDVAVDMRPGSPSYGKWHGVVLSGETGNQLYIPPGFAHGFLVLSETAVFAYKCSDFYYPQDEGGVRWDDPAIGIAWPDIGAGYILSEKDAKLPGLPPAPPAQGSHGLPERTLRMLEDILAGHRGIRSAVLYGSRATGAYRNGSDIDLTLHVDDSFSYNDLLRVKEAFNASDIPYMVDISDYRKISNENLKDHIQRAGKVLYRREGEPPG